MKHLAALLSVSLTIAAQGQITHELVVEDDEFNPPSLTIALGDHVHITWDNSVQNDHDVTQISEATWNVNGTTLLPGGFQFGVGTPNPGTDFTITPTATAWYICTIHASMGMKGVINVTGGNGIEEATAQELYQLAPNPANTTVTVVSPNSGAFNVRFTDAAGRLCMDRTLNAERTVDVSTLTEGLYLVEFRDLRGKLLARQRAVVAH
ncbi:MAG: T9SS type A sorting domain-containing protein [Flavobacteriales bacterium]|nr:T9SS type A sorting domain-containing protein [Flavobacteriales bacterium]